MMVFELVPNEPDEPHVWVQARPPLVDGTDDLMAALRERPPHTYFATMLRENGRVPSPLVVVHRCDHHDPMRYIAVVTDPLDWGTLLHDEDNPTHATDDPAQFVRELGRLGVTPDLSWFCFTMTTEGG